MTFVVDARVVGGGVVVEVVIGEVGVVGGGVVVEVVSERDKMTLVVEVVVVGGGVVIKVVIGEVGVVGGGVVVEVVRERDKGDVSSRSSISRRWCSSRSRYLDINTTSHQWLNYTYTTLTF